MIREYWHCGCGETFDSSPAATKHVMEVPEPFSIDEHWITHEVIRRPDWDDYFMGLAKAASERASCPRASIGAVIVRPDNSVVSTGYNGAPRGEPHCLDEGCIVEDGHCQRAIHAEMNALVYAREPLNGYRIYVYGREVCRECAKVLRAAGVSW